MFEYVKVSLLEYFMVLIFSILIAVVASSGRNNLKRARATALPIIFEEEVEERVGESSPVKRRSPFQESVADLSFLHGLERVVQPTLGVSPLMARVPATASPSSLASSVAGNAGDSFFLGEISDEEESEPVAVIAPGFAASSPLRRSAKSFDFKDFQAALAVLQ